MPYPVFAKNHVRSRYGGARVVAKVEWHNGELIPRVGFIVTNLKRSAKNNRDALKTHQLQHKTVDEIRVFCHF
jgi:hypothetical protein